MGTEEEIGLQKMNKKNWIRGRDTRRENVVMKCKKGKEDMFRRRGKISERKMFDSSLTISVS